MSKVRVLVGTKKGAFILEADGKRKDWSVSGPLFAGWEVYHMKGSPAEPDRIFASQTSGWFGQIIQRSSDGGKTWETPGGGPEKSPQGWRAAILRVVAAGGLGAAAADELSALPPLLPAADVALGVGLAGSRPCRLCRQLCRQPQRRSCRR